MVVEVKIVIRWIEGDALDTEFPQSSFDAITVGYGLRNVIDIRQALKEINRILKPGIPYHSYLILYSTCHQVVECLYLILMKAKSSL